MNKPLVKILDKTVEGLKGSKRVYDLVSYRIDTTMIFKPSERKEKLGEEGFAIIICQILASIG